MYKRQIEHCIGVHAHLLGVQQPVCQSLLVGLFHGGQLAEHRIVIDKGQQFFQFGGILAETGADVLFQRGSQARVAFQQPTAEGDAVGLVVELFRVQLIEACLLYTSSRSWAQSLWSRVQSGMYKPSFCCATVRMKWSIRKSS